MAGEARDEEATWRDLVAQYSTPVAADSAVPWPVREELSTAQQAPPGAPGPAGAPGSTDTSMDTTDAGGASAAPGTPGPGDSGTGRGAGTDRGAGTRGRVPWGRDWRRSRGRFEGGTGREDGTSERAEPRADGEDPGAAQPPRGDGILSPA